MNVKEIFFDGEIINLEKAPIITLERKEERIRSEQESIKNYIINLIETF